MRYAGRWNALAEFHDDGTQHAANREHHARETQAHIKSITRAFEDRVEHLQGVTSGILSSLETATHHFEHQTDMLDALSLRVDEQSTTIATALSIQGNQLTGAEGRIDRMVNRMNHAMNDVREVKVSART